MPTAAEWSRASKFVSPPDRIGREGVKQDAAELSPGYLRPTACTVIRVVQQHAAVLVECASLLAARVNDFKESIEESRSLQCQLAIVFVNVEHASLCPGVR